MKLVAYTVITQSTATMPVSMTVNGQGLEPSAFSLSEEQDVNVAGHVPERAQQHGDLAAVVHAVDERVLQQLTDRPHVRWSTAEGELDAPVEVRVGEPGEE